MQDRIRQDILSRSFRFGLSGALFWLSSLGFSQEGNCENFQGTPQQVAIAANPDVEVIENGTDHDGAYTIGIAITLPPGSWTYWRTPGEAGVAPVFSFTHSVNLATATVLYPAPERISEDGAEIFGYRDKIIFPLRIEPRDARETVTLSIKLDYAICERICLPRKTERQVRLSPSKREAEDPGLAEALSTVPAPLTAEALAAAIKIKAEPGYEHPTWRLQWVKGHARDLFVEAPEGWYFETKAADAPDEFLLRQIEAPKGADASSPPLLTLTLTGNEAKQSYEFVLRPPAQKSSGDSN